MAAAALEIREWFWFTGNMVASNIHLSSPESRVDRVKPPFLIVGLARSRTAWLAAFLTAHGHLTVHEPFTVYRGLMDLSDLWERGFRGISDPSIYLKHIDQLRAHFNRSPTAVILRDSNDAKAAFERWMGRRLLNWDLCETSLSMFRSEFNPFAVEYEKLDDFGAVNDLVIHLTGQPANRDLFRMFNLLKIEQHHGKGMAAIANNRPCMAHGGKS